MADMSLTKNQMPTQDPEIRGKNFDEVALGYTEEMALAEAARCLDCIFLKRGFVKSGVVQACSLSDSINQ